MSFGDPRRGQESRSEYDVNETRLACAVCNLVVFE